MSIHRFSLPIKGLLLLAVLSSGCSKTTSVFDLMDQATPNPIPTNSGGPQIPGHSLLRTGIYALGPVTSSQFTFMKNKFDVIVTSSYAPTPSDMAGFTGSLWTSYLDITTLSDLKQYLEMADYANSKGINAEEMLLHPKRDLAFDRGAAWEQIDKFDRFENANGILTTSNDITFTDRTSVAYTGNVTWQSTTYVGYELPFDQVNLVFSTFGNAVSRVWEYWNGNAWVALATTDGTNSFAQNGRISFVPPSNWARRVMNASRSKYFIRCRITAATVFPVTSSIKGDNWQAVPTIWEPNSANHGQYAFVVPTVPNGYVYYNKTGGISGGSEPAWPTASGATIVDGQITWLCRPASNTSRGWDASSGTIVNAGELAYNPTPPAGATAKFRHQARTPTWGVNHFVFNLADKQVIDGVLTRTSSAYLAYATHELMAKLPLSGMMYDDGISSAILSNVLPKSMTDFSDKAGGASVLEVDLARYQELIALMKKDNPNHKYGANAMLKSMVTLGDFNLYEYFNYSTTTGDNDNTKFATTDSATNMCYDDYLDDGSLGLMIYADVVNVQSGTFWDRSNRGPITVLSKHLIGNNPNTVFMYFSYGAAIYMDRDEFYYTDTNTTVLTDSLPIDTSYNAKTIHGDFTNFDDATVGLVIGSGDSRDVTVGSFTKVNNSTITFSQSIYFTHAAGEVVRFQRKGHFATDPIPSISRIVKWGSWFPAMETDFGTGGSRNMAWASGDEHGWGSGTKNNVWSRDYTNALVLLRPNGGPSSSTDYATYSAPLPLGQTYYPLSADGKTGPGITSIQLRRNEGAILMKSPIP